MKFKVGDKVRRFMGSYNDMRVGDEDIISSIDEHNITLKNYGFGHSHSSFEVIGKSTKNQKPDDLVRYMAYGMGCCNQGDIVRTEKDLKEELKEKVHDGNWSGRIIGYKLTPLYEAEKTTRLKKFKIARGKKK